MIYLFFTGFEVYAKYMEIKIHIGKFKAFTWAPAGDCS